MAAGTTRGKRRLGRYVQELFDASGLTQAELALTADTTRQTIARMLKGEVLAKWQTVCTVLVELGASGAQIKEAKKMHAVADVSTASIEHARNLPQKYTSFRMDEADAKRARTLDQSLIPGLLQTAPYAEECARRAWRRITGETWNEQAAAERRDRQALLYRDAKPLEFHALIDEAALNRYVGGPEVMLGQLAHLEESANLPNVTIQIVPGAVGAYGAHSSPIVLLTFHEPDEPDAAFIEGWTGTEHVDPEDVDAIGVLSAVWGDVAVLALSTEDSIAVIRQAKDRVSSYDRTCLAQK